MIFPVIDRVAPQLTGSAEIIRRNPRNYFGEAVLVQLEHLWFRPDIGTVRGDEDRDIPDEVDSLVIGIFFQSEPLLEEYPLKEFLISDLVFQFPGDHSLLGFCGFPVFLLPLQPADSFLGCLDGHEHGIIVKPLCLFTKCIK